MFYLDTLRAGSQYDPARKVKLLQVAAGALGSLRQRGPGEVGWRAGAQRPAPVTTVLGYDGQGTKPRPSSARITCAPPFALR